AAQAKENGEALKLEWQKDVPDAARVHAMVDAQLAAVQRFAHSLADTALEVHRMLTPEQRAHVSKRLAKHEQKPHKER
ncbi:MAG: hypothetical protein JNG84_15155, partial [Archangium sp.]|nr:hypothetical protein [Archangium sp.]